MRRLASVWSGLILGCAGLAGTACADPLVAEVTLNGQQRGDVVSFDQQGSDLRAPAGELRRLGLTLGGDDDATLVSLSNVRGLAYSLDAPTQTVRMTVDPGELAANRLAAPSLSYRRPDRAAWGAVLNYAAYAFGDDSGEMNGSVTAEARVFGPVGVFHQGFIRQRPSEGRFTGFRRLDTSFVVDRPDTARTLTFGDFVSSALPWTQAVRAAGISYATDFSLRPDLVVQPLPVVHGAAASPSTVDLYVDGVRRFTTQTSAGPFTVDTTPMMDGHGQVSLVVTDSLGRRTVQDLSFYATSDLLAPRTSSFAVEGGWLREAYATSDDRYTDGFATAVGRYGLNDHLTVEGHATMTGNIKSAGAGVVAKAGEAALFAAAFDASSGKDGAGGKVILSARRETRAYSIFANFQQASSNFHEISWREGDSQVRRAVEVGASVRTDRWGAFSVSYNDIETGRGRLQVAGLNWSREVGPLNLYANVLRSRDERSATVVSLGFSTLLRHERSVSAQAVTSNGRSRYSAQVSSAPPLPYGWGWSASAETSAGGARDPPRLEGELRRTSPVGEAGIGLARQGSRTYAQAYTSGSLVLMGGQVRAAARVGDSFALIQTGEPGVALTLENNPVGVTDKHGALLATQIPANTTARVAIVADSVPLDREILVQQRTIRPPRGAGIIANLPVERIAAAIVQVVDPSGAALPVGAAVRLNGKPAGRLGFDGEVYLKGLKPHNIIEIIDQSGYCRLEAPYVPQADALPRIGPLACVLSPGRDLPGDRSLYAVDSPGGELLGADANAELRPVRPEGPAADGLQQRLHRDEVHLQRSGLRRLWLRYRNPLKWFGWGRS